jgi:hypothetical protein
MGSEAESGQVAANRFLAICANIRPVPRPSAPIEWEPLDSFAEKIGVELPVITRERRTIICPRKSLDGLIQRNPADGFDWFIITEAEVRAEAVCSICTQEFILNEEVAILSCRHMFHPDCIRLWMNRQRSCPFCRHDLSS